MESKLFTGRNLPPCVARPILGVIVSGCSGRMGRRLLSHTLADPELRLLGGICRAASENIPCRTPHEGLLKEGQEGQLTTTDPSGVGSVSTYVQELGVVVEANKVKQWPMVIKKRKQLEIEAPVCATLDELLTLLELSHVGSNPTIVVDFSHPAATMALLQTCVRRHIPVVVGTTGFTADEKRAIAEAAEEIPLCVAANFSLGVNLLIKLVGEVTTALGEQFDIELVESHHRLKADAPSGTALSLLDSIAKARQKTGLSDACCSELECEPVGFQKRQSSNELYEVGSVGPDVMTLVHGRLGVNVGRKQGEVGVHSLRLGNVVGEHSVIYASIYEKLVLQHHAQSRDVFAVGALKMAKWLASKPKGEYSMNDMLFEKSARSQSCQV